MKIYDLENLSEDEYLDMLYAKQQLAYEEYLYLNTPTPEEQLPSSKTILENEAEKLSVTERKPIKNDDIAPVKK